MSFKHFLNASMLGVAALLSSTAVVGNAHASDFSFDVHNSTDSRITKILVSENRKSWGQFNIGRGIQPGATTKLVWDKSTNNEACVQWVKAVFADGSEAKPAKFDFCEDDLEIEF
ncbi:MAG: hypothetical protein KAX57_09215 [Rhodoferax sp.]|jgi:hypothetical protein|uniref:hypothetical protein n=1 Tax=Rhodoferax sp. TaxID=50421 RepID=UPI001B56ED42|nr:hypothetical protein [Rhodoferax sp.]MBP8287004.1 hypothetical protein [Rhodoferax sp.]MBP9149761.1 hypothetical protein [Rhodoferax sp.]MBP9734913.1 hypothetical protein [Rhodoferax sp.]